MTFQLAEKYEFDWPVLVKVPEMKDGAPAFVEHRFTARFLLLEEGETDRIAALAAELSDPEFLKKALVGWGEDVTGPDKKPLKFSPKARDRMIQNPIIRKGLLKAYFESVSGELIQEYQEKN